MLKLLKINYILESAKISIKSALLDPFLKLKETKKIFAFSIILITAFICKIAFLLIFPAPPILFDANEYNQLAKSILNGNGYMLHTTAYPTTPGKPTASRVPLYPLYLAVIFSLFGYSYKILKLSHLAMQMMTIVLTYAIAYKISQEVKVALLAMFMHSFYFPFYPFLGVVFSENLYTVLLAFFTLFIILAYESNSHKIFFLSGCFLGLSILTNPSPQFFIIFIVGLLYLFFQKEKKLLIKFSGSFLIGLVIVLSPWIIRNYLVFHALVPTSTLGGLNLYSGNYALTEERIKSGGIWWDHSKSAAEGVVMAVETGTRQKVAGLSEPEVDRYFLRKGISLIIKHPLQFLPLVVKRFIILWTSGGYGNYLANLGYGKLIPNFYDVIASRICAVWNIILILLALTGTILLRNKLNFAALLIITMLVYFTILYSVSMALLRYSIPLIPQLITLSAYGIVHSRNKIT